MKELSIEEKVRRYDKAVEKLRSLHDDYDTVSTLIDIKEELENIFPELKESEDERIRKEIKNFLSRIMLGQENFLKEDYDWNAWIAWLEQQGQDGKVWFYRDDYVKDKKQAYQDGIDKVLNNPQKYGLEKQCEQKPAEDVDLPEFESYLCLMFQKFRTKGMCTNGEIIDYVNEHSQKLMDILVKPAWSEEDEKILDRVITNYESGYLPSVEKRDEIIKKLESLKERYTWKPSDEQMEALESATENCAYSEYQDCLRELIEQLKKLKG